MNLHDEGDGCELLTDRIAGASDGKALAVRVSHGSNRVVFATDVTSMRRFDREFSRRWAARRRRTVHATQRGDTAAAWIALAAARQYRLGP